MDNNPYYDIRKAASVIYRVPMWLIDAQITAESNWNPRAKSHCGAMGLMQLMPVVCEEMGVADPYDPQDNIMGGVGYLAKLLKSRFVRGDIALALAAYNGGIGNLKKYRGIPPFKETREYVAKIMAMKPEGEPETITPLPSNL